MPAITVAKITSHLREMRGCLSWVMGRDAQGGLRARAVCAESLALYRKPAFIRATLIGAAGGAIMGMFVGFKHTYWDHWGAGFRADLHAVAARTMARQQAPHTPAEQQPVARPALTDGVDQTIKTVRDNMQTAWAQTHFARAAGYGAMSAAFMAVLMVPVAVTYRGHRADRGPRP